MLIALMVLALVAALAIFVTWTRRRSSDRSWKVADYLFGIGVWVYIIVGIGWAVRNTIGVHHLSAEAVRSGLPCTATVLSRSDTGNTLNHKRVFEFTLRVQPTSGSAYPARLRDALDSVEGGRLGAGVTDFRCVIDRKDASRVAVFWDRPAATQPSGR